MKKAPLPKFPITGNNPGLKGYEVTKIVDGIEREERRQELRWMVPVAMAIAAVVVALCIVLPYLLR
jgi:hypothetical protein